MRQRPVNGRLELVDGRWRLSGCPPHVAIRLKQVFAKLDKADKGPWTFADDLISAADLDWFLQRFPMAMSRGDRQRLAWRAALYHQELDQRDRILVPGYRPAGVVGLREGQVARDYQLQAVDLLERRRTLLLGDDVGLGKTYAGALACLLEGALPACIVVPLQVQAQWAEKIAAFTTLTTHQIRTTRPYSLPPADVYLWRYSNCGPWVDVVGQMEVGLACWDEFHSLRGGTATAKGKFCKALAERAQLRLGLTATPIYNYGDETWHLYQFIEPDLLGSYDEFSREWLGGGSRTVVDPEALGAFLRSEHVYMRRRRSDVADQLPPVNKVLETIDHAAHELARVEDRARALAFRASTGEFTERGQAARELDLLVRQATGISKAKAVADYVRILVESGHPVLLMGWHREVYAIWQRQLADLKPVMFTGSETAREKQASLRAFIAGESDLLIMSLRSGEGIDGLQYRCSTVVFGELDWSPAVHEQIIGRLNRERSDGVRNAVLAVFLAADDGSDPPMIELLGLKASQAAGVVDVGMGVQRVETGDQGLRELIRRYAERPRALPRDPGDDLPVVAAAEPAPLLAILQEMAA